jgi:hypothetical protein
MNETPAGDTPADLHCALYVLARMNILRMLADEQQDVPKQEWWRVWSALPNSIGSVKSGG